MAGCSSIHVQPTSAGHRCAGPVARGGSGLEAVLGADLESAGVRDKAAGISVSGVVAAVVLEVEAIKKIGGHRHTGTRYVREVFPQPQIHAPIPPCPRNDEAILRRREATWLVIATRPIGSLVNELAA